jgi:hypothetical protein
MEDLKQLIGIGYWHSFLEPHFPDPGSFVDEAWNKDERKRILEYMHSGFSMPYAAGGVS